MFKNYKDNMYAMANMAYQLGGSVSKAPIDRPEGCICGDQKPAAFFGPDECPVHKDKYEALYGDKAVSFAHCAGLIELVRLYQETQALKDKHPLAFPVLEQFIGVRQDLLEFPTEQAQQELDKL